MPITLTIDRDQRVVYSALHGVITESEFLEHAHTIRSHPQFDAGFSEIIDFRGVTDVSVSTAALERLASSASIFDQESRHVIIAPAGLISDLVRMYQTLAESTRPRIAIVRTPEEAYDQLR